ncbi:hypothetical protein [Dictyobacter arantiisoli]|uniref:Uncharacterized protein n=1 Tax=Dictyobacter arantiisoli TaxID=2014874 RepID=A0A5A5TJZ3_9CHLR|nr:hypothetical protein [Dictyobacter arantiisoli]GCF11214.1 hypothetical protein KDI_47780 [Dictyobacter arantiisoli]
MVRVLSPSLMAAVGASTRVPAIAISIEDHVPHYQSYQTPNSTDGWNDACIANDGSIIRVSLTRGSNIFAQSFQWQRITNPATAGQWSSWNTFGGAASTCYQDSGCAVSNSNGTLRAFAQQGSSRALWTWSSTDNGQTWSATPGTVLTPPSSAALLGIGSAGNNDVFFLYQLVSGVYTGCAFFSGTWSALHTSSVSPLNYGGGVAAYWDGSAYWIVASDTATLYLSTYTPGSNSWLAYQPIATAASALLVRLAPRLQRDPISGLYTLISIEEDTGVNTGAVYSYPRLRQSSDLQHWSQGTILHSINVQYGATLIVTPTATFLSSMPTILRARAYNQSDSSQQLSVSGTLDAYSQSDEIGKPGKLQLLLDNNQGALSALISQPSNPQPLGPQSSVIVRAGYRTGSPANTTELVRVGTYRIERIQVVRTQQQQQLRLLCVDTTAQLDQLNRFQMTYTYQQLGWLLREVCARAGLFSLALPTASQINQTVPYFVIQAARPYRAALDELCRIYDLSFFLDQNEVVQFRELSASDPVTWTYQPELESITFGSQQQSGNHVIVTGKPPVSGTSSALTTAEAYDDTNLQWTGQERLIQHIDQKLITTAQCASKAAFLLSSAQRAQVQHQIQVPFNPAHQLLDVIKITDASIPRGSGLSSAGRIIQSDAIYDPAQAAYTHTLHLTGV